MNEKELRLEFCALGRSLFERGYASGSAGNISLRLEDGTFLATPSGSCLGRLDPERLSLIDASGKLLSGDRASKEVKFHLTLYNADPRRGAVVHLHSTWATMLSCLEHPNREEIIRPFTPYYVMKIGTLPLIPYYPPGDPRIARDLETYGSDRNAFLLQNHGPVVCGGSIGEAVDRAEELEETARLMLLMRNLPVRYLTNEEIAELRGR